MGLGVFFFLFLPSLFSRHSSINPSIRQASRRASLFVLAFCFSRCSRFSRIKFVHIIIYPYPTYIHRIMIALDWTRFFCLFHFVHIQQKSTMYKCISSSLYRIFAFWSFCTLRSIYSALLCYFKSTSEYIHTYIYLPSSRPNSDVLPSCWRWPYSIRGNCPIRSRGVANDDDFLAVTHTATSW